MTSPFQIDLHDGEFSAFALSYLSISYCSNVIGQIIYIMNIYNLYKNDYLSAIIYKHYYIDFVMQYGVT